MKMWIVVIITGIITQLFRMSGEFIPIPKNKFMDKFLEAIPISVLVILFFPDIFTSVGRKPYEIFIALLTILVIIYMTIKKQDMGKIMIVSVILVILLNLLLSNIF